MDISRATNTTSSWAPLLFGLLLFCPSSLRAEAQEKSESDARLLEQRLHAPCCREQLLDGHDSELARGLRRELRVRLRAGESSTAIEADLKTRFGSSIVAIPADRDPRDGLSILLILTMSSAALGLLLLGLRWVRRSRTLPLSATANPPESALDAQLDRELRQLDG